MIDRQTEYASQVPAAARAPRALQSPSQYTTTPLGKPPEPRTPTGPFVLPATEPVAVVDKARPPALPRYGNQAAPEVTTETPVAESKPVLLGGEKKPKQEKPVKHSRDLQDYSYDLSTPEFARVRQENPTASKTVTSQAKAALLSWDEYDKLTPDQRAAVDFNSLLVQAREIDLKTDPKFYSEPDLEKYRADLASIFGDAGGSDTVGFRTVELLKKIDFTAVGQDLDEYLSLERGISAKELKNFTFSKDDVKQLTSFTPMSVAQPGIGKDYVAARSPANMAAIDTAAIQAALSSYKNSFNVTGPNTGNIVEALGIQMPAPMMERPGFERAGEYDSKLDQSLKDAYDFLRTNPNEAGMAAIFQDFKDRSWTEEDQQMLWSYLNERTAQDIQYFDDAGSKQVRALLGWK